MTDFDRSMAFVARWEGGKVDHPSDPGGRTNAGVTQRTYDMWRTKLGQPTRDVFQLTDDERDAIYREAYWKAANCDEQAWPLCLVHFDTAVNCGVGRALQWLLDSQANVPAYLALRRAHYARIVQKNPRLAVFARGWENRMKSLEKEAA